METGNWNLFNNSISSSSGVRGQHGNWTTNNNPAWGIWELGNLHNNNSFNQDTFHFPSSSPSSSATIAALHTATTSTSTSYQHESTMHALMFATHQSASSSSPSSSSYYNGGGGSCYYPDPHLTCLKLGKRHYFENASPPHLNITKKGKPYYGHGGFDSVVNGGGGGGLVGHSTSAVAALTVAAAPATIPRCQVEGCKVVLVNAKDYHRRHKVCEVHSKAPKVVVLGVEQRFCQQCSRFHAVSEFDDSKRSCRRRLAGHNERRRKNSQDHSTPRNMIQDDKLMAGRYPYFPLNSSSALSLLSSKNDSWMSSADLSARCSAALRELIAENRAAILARQLILERNWHWRSHPIEDSNELQNRSSSFESFPQQMVSEPHSWENVNAGTHLTLDLKQTPSSAFGYLSVQGKSKEEECSELWGALKGTRVL